jgi:hypothetical protein
MGREGKNPPAPLLLLRNSRKTDSPPAAGLACSSPTWCRAFAAFTLLRNSRKTDSLPAAKSAEFLFRLAPPEAAFALLSGSNHLVWIDDELLRRALVEIDVALRRLIE